MVAEPTLPEPAAGRPAHPRRAALGAGGIMGVVVVVDQLSKAWVIATVAPGDSRSVLPGIHLVDVRNHGVAFSLLSGGGAPVIALITLAVVTLIGYFVTHLQRPLLWLPTGLLLGGALGNLSDRLRGDGVVDFIDLPHWPAFNVADAAITVGVVALLGVIEFAPDRRGGP